VSRAPAAGDGPSNRRGRARPETPAPKLREAVEFKRMLDELSSRVRRLAPPDARNPTRFHEERSEIARQLQRLAERVEIATRLLARGSGEVTDAS
jgi:hypothetical protein